VSPITTAIRITDWAAEEPRLRPMKPSFHSLKTMISVALPGPPWVTAWITPNDEKNAKTMLTTTR